jgi:fimbrial chaperone protein
MKVFEKYKYLAGALFLTALFLMPSVSLAAGYKVSPIKLYFKDGLKSGAVTISNEGEETLNVRMKVMQWTQDEEGKDQYADSADIIFFPKMMTLKMGGKRVLRAGIKMPATKAEKTYRLFIEEIPNTQEPEGTAVKITVTFAVPIFVSPMPVDAKGSLEDAKLSKGEFNVIVRNSGNVHFMINEIDIKGTDVKGEEVFNEKIKGWYLLSGASRRYAASIPEKECKEMKTLDVHVKTDKFNLDGMMEVEESMCVR